MTDRQNKKQESKSVLRYYKIDGGDKEDFQRFWKNIKQNDYNLDEQDETGKTVLMYTISEATTEKAWTLLEFFADPNIQTNGDKKTALHIAVEEGKKEFQFLLLLFGADPKIKDYVEVDEKTAEKDKDKEKGKTPFDGKEDDLKRYQDLVDELKKTFIILTRKRRKNIRCIFNTIEEAGGVSGRGTIDEGCIRAFYTELYGERVSDSKLDEDVKVFVSEILKYKIDTNEKDIISFEDFMVAFLRIAKAKGLPYLDQLLQAYKSLYDEKKRKDNGKEGALLTNKIEPAP